MYTLIDVGQLGLYGKTYWLPLASAANIAQGAAALAVALKTRNQKTKSMAVPSAMSCFMGITEPAIFGVNLRFFKPLSAERQVAPAEPSMLPSWVWAQPEPASPVSSACCSA